MKHCEAFLSSEVCSALLREATWDTDRTRLIQIRLAGSKLIRYCCFRKICVFISSEATGKGGWQQQQCRVLPLNLFQLVQSSACQEHCNWNISTSHHPRQWWGGNHVCFDRAVFCSWEMPRNCYLDSLVVHDLRFAPHLLGFVGFLIELTCEMIVAELFQSPLLFEHGCCW